MLSRGELDMRERLLELDVPVKVVRVQHLFPPVDLDAGFLAGLHPAIASSAATCSINQ